jgi:Transposase and inactivated derivatives
MRHEVIVGVERRRHWSDEEKLSILREVGIGGATVSDVARRHDLTRQHIYQWRRALRRKGLWPGADGTVFLALDASAEPLRSGPSARHEMSIEIVLGNGRVVRLNGGLQEDDLARLIRLVETA